MNDGLKRQLGFWDSVAINIGIVIGVGIFRVPAEVSGYLQAPSVILLAWLAAGLLALLGVFCYAELSSCLPHTGGTYVYLKKAYGKTTAFLFGWTEILILRAGSLAGVAYIFAAYMGNLAPLSAGGEKFIAVLGISLYTCINIAGLHYGTRIQNFLSSLKIGTILLIAAVILAAGLKEGTVLPAASGGFDLAGFGPALVVILWTYGGWEESTFMSGEFRDTRRALPRSLIASIVIITALYILINYAYLTVMTPAEMKSSPSIASDIFERLFGDTGKMIITLAVLLSASGALNSYILTGARIPFAVARDLERLKWLGTVHEKYSTPASAYALNAVWASVLIVWGNFEGLLFFTGFSKWFFYMLIGIGVFIIRKRSAGELQSFKMPGYPWVPLLFTVSSAALLVTIILYSAKAALFGALLMGAGLPFFWIFGGKKKAQA